MVILEDLETGAQKEFKSFVALEKYTGVFFLYLHELCVKNKIFKWENKNYKITFEEQEEEDV